MLGRGDSVAKTQVDVGLSLRLDIGQSRVLVVDDNMLARAHVRCKRGFRVSRGQTSCTPTDSSLLARAPASTEKALLDRSVTRLVFVRAGQFSRVQIPSDSVRTGLYGTKRKSLETANRKEPAADCCAGDQGCTCV